MPNDPPALITIAHDDHHAKHVGWTSDGHQFFLTTPFEPAIGGRDGAEFIALYLFDVDGRLIQAKIDELGPRASLNKTKGPAIARPATGRTRAGKVWPNPGRTLLSTAIWHDVRPCAPRTRRGWRPLGSRSTAR